MMNREFYEKDPRTNTLLNQGVAKVTTGQSDPEIDTLRYEISNFVCDGQYADGSEAHLDDLPRQSGQVGAAGRLGERVLRIRQEPSGQDAATPLDRLRVP